MRRTTETKDQLLGNRQTRRMIYIELLKDPSHLERLPSETAKCRINIGGKMRSRTRLACHWRQSPSLSSSASALSSTSDQSPALASSPTETVKSLSSSNTSFCGDTTSNRGYSASDSSTFVQQNPRYSSLWLQKCSLPKRLDPSTLNATTENGLDPDCYPYPNMADSVGKS